jgi:hypothetical protein
VRIDWRERASKRVAEPERPKVTDLLDDEGVTTHAVMPVGKLKATATPASRPKYKGIYDIRSGFRVNFFYCEDFVHLYDKLFTPGKRSSRSWR